MAKKKSTEPEVIVTDKEYLRNVGEICSEKIKSNTRNTLLILYSLRNSCHNNFVNINADTYFICDCKESANQIQHVSSPNIYDSYNCKFCKARNKYGWSKVIYTDEMKKMLNEKQTNEKDADVIYISANPEVPNSFLIQLLNIENDYDYSVDTMEYKPKKVISVKSAVEVIPGVSVKGYKVLKRSIKEMDVFDALNINSQTIDGNYSRHIVYEDSKCLYDFLNKYKIFGERTGFLEALKNYPDKIMYNESAFMLLHLCMISAYPVLEFLIKMGYNKLYYDMITQFKKAQSRIEIREIAKNLTKIFTTSTKGSMGLRIPNYIGEYLKNKAAQIPEYINWCNLYELQPMSKEQFERYVSSAEFMAMQFDGTLRMLPNIIKYGYTIEQATKYIYKQSMRTMTSGVLNTRACAQNMCDYLAMCEMLEMKPNKFPSDITQAHNEVMSLRRSSGVIDYSKMESIGRTTQELLDGFIDPKELTKLEKEYFIKVPSSEHDFIEEGNLQNSCVGHYAKKVNDGERIVFFVRKKDDPTDSFITAEYVCSTGKLGQCMKKNNIDVDDEELLTFCKVACNRIKTGLLTGKIH